MVLDDMDNQVQMVITRTPVRISFFGGGTDYPVWYEKNGGAVLSTSINKYNYITCRFISPLFGCKYRIRYRLQEERDNIFDIDHPSARECLAFANFDQGVEIQHSADLPGFSGIGSSSAFTVGLLNAIYALRGIRVSKKQLALDAIHIEQDRIKENIGSQDQTIAAFGGLNKIKFGGAEKVEVLPLNLDFYTTRKLEQHLMLFFIGHPRKASDVAIEQIQNTPNKQKELEEMYKMVDEGEKILKQKDGDLTGFGKLLHESWLLKRSLTSKISNQVIDEIYEEARMAGAVGGKLLGAGGGGFMLFFASPENQLKIREKLKRLVYTPFNFESSGSTVIYSSPQTFIV